ncbi:unnamed protein product [Meloidogyne enterolobii]|uniref:Uncharacterized protein n=3 Tax=Meloidogyne enterolobii TaxID=390850 RepID=A0A6V7UK52_MELEN|nr:unnamed protein product [Meloidogyne enterolobii]
MQQNFIFINFLQSFNLFHFFFFLISNAAVLFEESLNNVGNAGGVGSSVSAYEENFGGTTINRHKALGKNTNLSPYSSSGSSAQFPINERLQTFVHTFETLEQCAVACPRPCAMTVMEELEMMQRWICDPNARLENYNQHRLPQTDKNFPSSSRTERGGKDANKNNFLQILNNQALLIIVPIILLIILSSLILIRRCGVKSTTSSNSNSL